MMEENATPNCPEDYDEEEGSCCEDIRIYNSKDDFDLECTICGDCDECDDCKEKVICVMPCDHQITYAFVKPKKYNQKNPLCCQCNHNCRTKKQSSKIECSQLQQQSPRCCSRNVSSKQSNNKQVLKCMSAEIQCNLSDDDKVNFVKKVSPCCKESRLLSTHCTHQTDVTHEQYPAQTNRMNGAYPVQTNVVNGECPTMYNIMDEAAHFHNIKMCEFCPMLNSQLKDRMYGQYPLQDSNETKCFHSTSGRKNKKHRKPVPPEEPIAKQMRSYARYLERKIAHFSRARSFVVRELDVIDSKSVENRKVWEERIDAAKIHLMILLKKLIRYKMQLRERFACINQMREDEFGKVPQHGSSLKKFGNKFDNNEMLNNDFFKGLDESTVMEFTNKENPLELSEKTLEPQTNQKSEPNHLNDIRIYENRIKQLESENANLTKELVSLRPNKTPTTNKFNRK